MCQFFCKPDLQGMAMLIVSATEIAPVKLQKIAP